MEAMSSRLSSVRLEADASAVLSSGQNEAPKQSLLSRRNARRVSPPYAHGIGEPIPERSEDTSSSSSNFQNYLRPITPSQPLMPDDGLMPNDEFPPALGASTPSDILVADGPMTPRNNAGPFVFDGSAGRAGAWRTAISLRPRGGKCCMRLLPQADYRFAGLDLEHGWISTWSLVDRRSVMWIIGGLLLSAASSFLSFLFESGRHEGRTVAAFWISIFRICVYQKVSPR